MTAPESESLVESIMDHYTTITKPQTLYTKNRLNDSDDDEEEEECDVEVWEMLSKSFIQVQSVLDQNRVLINQVNENHQSKIADNLAKNVALIREINTNISKVLSIYSDLSLNFSTIVHQRRAAMINCKRSVDDKA
ncbi:protein EARLY FLOWERING 4-like [Quercus lobata]|uniref:Protein EARLY FLOWERING 4 domain-containing protein n=1 Tax=Quercus lobata TaxID=97700 RepID=A0A7N2QXV4_QUELO|nr:protein EARLY FLOWERING 4-like [Quercus lobata]XP_030969212.1 protein EARLY FLOWERING 4-like [Quercus lobata]